MTQATRATQDSAETRTLNVSLELSKRSWKLAFSDGSARRPRVVAVPARDWGRFEGEVEKAKGRFGLPSDAPVRSCYEAGRDGFWMHRVLLHHGIENLVVDPASIEVNRRRRRTAAAAGRSRPLRQTRRSQYRRSRLIPDLSFMIPRSLRRIM